MLLRPLFEFVQVQVYGPGSASRTTCLRTRQMLRNSVHDVTGAERLR